MNKDRSARDRLGNIVKEGDSVRLLSLHWNGIRELPKREQHDLKTMIGEVYEVQEIDAHGNVWISKIWNRSSNGNESHSLALTSEEFERVDKTSYQGNQGDGR